MKIKKFSTLGLIGLILILISLSSWNRTTNYDSLFKKEINDSDFKINIIDKDSLLSKDIAVIFRTTFYEAYPKMVTKYNSKTPKTVPVTIDGSYNGVAYANNGGITVSAEWLRKYPNDTDLLVHELMHLVQAYTAKAPGWLTEGIADYVRDEFGMNNTKANWKLPLFKEGQKYTDSYRTTGSFLRWITQNYDASFVVKMDENLRDGTYSEKLWKEFTGSSVTELWLDYSKS